jgi:hypothetical protein
VKCARDADIIRSETKRVKSFSELGPLAEALCPIEHELHSLPGDAVHYYTQALIDGEPLLSLLGRAPWGEASMAHLDAILSLERRCYEAAPGDLFALTRVDELLSLTPIDCGRALQSLAFLEKAGATAKQLGHWPSDVPTPAETAEAVRPVINTWNTWTASLGRLKCIGQHGDLNPGNVIITVAGKAILIDFARLGRWPVGYDIARLATMLRIRLTDSTGHRDWMENRLISWAAEPFCCRESVKLETSLCPGSAYCDQNFMDSIQTREPAEKRQLLRGYQVATLWDLIKVLSYADLSVFKRLWVLVECWRLQRDIKAE